MNLPDLMITALRVVRVIFGAVVLALVLGDIFGGAADRVDGATDPARPQAFSPNQTEPGGNHAARSRD
jgi:hypothetical protein